MPYNKQELIKYRLERSFQTANEAKSALELGHLFSAENRIYYACFYAVTALALSNDFVTSKHKQLIGWFNHNYIRTGLIPIKYGQTLKNAFSKRQESDYDDYVSFELEEVESDFNDMLEFINFIKNSINNQIIS